MPLLTFKYLPIRGARLEAVRLNWLLREVVAECRILDDVRESVVTLSFRQVNAVHLQLGSAPDEIGRIIRCSEEAGVFKIGTSSNGELEISAAGHDVR